MIEVWESGPEYQTVRELVVAIIWDESTDVPYFWSRRAKTLIVV